MTFLDSTGISALVLAHRRASDHGVYFSLAAPSPTVRKVIDLTGIDKVLTVHATMRSALAEGRAHLAATTSTDQHKRS